MSWRHSSNPISTGRLWKFLERNLQNEDQCVALFFLSLHLGGFFPKVGFTSVQCHACYPFSITVSRPTSRAQHSRLVRMRLLILTSDSSFLLVDTFLKGSCFRPLASLYSSVFYFWDKNSRHPLDDDWAISISLFWLIPLFLSQQWKFVTGIIYSRIRLSVQSYQWEDYDFVVVVIVVVFLVVVSVLNSAQFPSFVLLLTNHVDTNDKDFRLNFEFSWWFLLVVPWAGLDLS